MEAHSGRSFFSMLKSETDPILRNGFEPYDRAALKKHDPEIFALLKTIWNGDKTRE